VRMMTTLEVPVEAGNEAPKGGRLPQLLEHVRGSLKSEAAYFSSTDDGSRGGYIVFDLKDPSQIPVIVEPLYQAAAVAAGDDGRGRAARPEPARRSYIRVIPGSRASGLTSRSCAAVTAERCAAQSGDRGPACRRRSRRSWRVSCGCLGPRTERGVADPGPLHPTHPFT